MVHSPIRDIARPAVSAPWHAQTAEAVLRQLGASRNGLTPGEVERRLADWGPNALPDLEQRSRLDILSAQLRNLPSALLLGSSAISTLIGDRFDAAAILTAVGLNAGIGYGVERSTEELLASWRQLEAGEAQAVRAGALRVLPASRLVPGDVILCRAGDRVPADARLLEVHRLSCDESALSGESEPVPKGVAPVAPRAVLSHRSSMLYAGSIIATGHCRAVIVATGAATEAAQVRGLLESAAAPRTPLQRQLDHLGRVLAAAGIGSGVLTALAGLLHGRPPLRALRNGVALAVAAIPEGLPMVSTAALVRSMRRMRTRGMVVRRVASAETLGGVTVVCADKTGTLTATTCGWRCSTSATARSIPLPCADSHAVCSSIAPRWRSPRPC
jgi:Ca2+-transporting ATPase